MIFNLLHKLLRYRFIQHGSKSSFVEMDNCLLHFLDSGKNDYQETVLLIHGLGTSTSAWIHAIPFYIKIPIS